MENPQNKEMQLIYKALNYEFMKQYIKYTSITKSSLMFFMNDTDDKLKIIESLFGLKHNENIKNKYNQVTGGDGSEGEKISTLHSSSLCAFLHFYNVEEKPIFINNIMYDQAYFEVKNKVFNTPSNMDIVLISSKHKKVLFLESKFSEYLSTDFQYNTSIKYKNAFEKFNITDNYVINEFEDGKKIKLISKDNKKHYIEGIKQMIAHYIGSTNFIKDKISLDKRIILNDDYTVELGTILFNGWPDENYFKTYKEDYEKLAHNINANPDKSSNLTILDSVLTYQDIFKNYNLDKNVKEYYKYAF